MHRPLRGKHLRTVHHGGSVTGTRRPLRRDPAYDVTSAWHLLDRASRLAFREIVGADDATWHRGRGLVVSGGILALT